MLAAGTPTTERTSAVRFGQRLASSRPAAGPMGALAGSGLADRFRFWSGRSGRRYVFSVYDAEDCRLARYDNAVVIVAARTDPGSQRIIDIDETGVLPDLVFDGARLRDAMACGATEIHVHLLAATDAEREAVIVDLRPTDGCARRPRRIASTLR